MKKNFSGSAATAGVFALVLGALFLLNLFRSPTEVSTSERRKLAQFPELTVKAVLSTGFMSKFEDFALDQFSFREGFRQMKSFLLYNVFRQTDKNGLYVVNGSISKFTAMDEKSFLEAKTKLETLIAQYCGNSASVTFALIPDKNYYMSALAHSPAFDYERIRAILSSVEGAEYVELYQGLNLEDYYKTDLHWDQTRLQSVVALLGDSLGVAMDLSSLSTETLGQFAGAYYGQAALPLEKDTLSILTGELLDGVTVTALNEKTLQMEPVPLYEREAFTGVDPYDVFLGGAVPLVELNNPNASIDKELVLFRDSFGSSIAPLLSIGYAKVTLVDLRYLASPLLGDYVNFEAADVLFLYSPEILNNSSVLLVK